MTSFWVPFIARSPDSDLPPAPVWSFPVYAFMESFLTLPKVVFNVAVLFLLVVAPLLIIQHYKALALEAELSVHSTELSRKLDTISTKLAFQPEDALLEASRAVRSSIALTKQAQRLNSAPGRGIAEITTRARALFQAALALVNARAFSHKVVAENGPLRLLVPNQRGDRVVIALRSSSTSHGDSDESVLLWKLQQMTTTELDIRAACPTLARVSFATFTDRGNVLVGTSTNCVTLYDDSGFLLMHRTERCGADDGIVFGAGIGEDDGVLIQGADGTLCVRERADMSLYKWPTKMRLTRVERSFWSKSRRYVVVVSKWGVALIDSKMGNLAEYYPQRNMETMGTALGIGSVFLDQPEKHLFVVVGEGRANMVAIREFGLKPMWETLLSKDDVRVGAFSDEDREVEVITRDGHSIILDAASGKKLWEWIYSRQLN